MNALERQYKEVVIRRMMDEFGYENPMAVPGIEKISINVGLSRAQKNAEFINDVTNDIKMITGQAPVFTKARKAIAGFKVREGQNIGLIVTLRGKRMWDFVHKFIGATIPRTKDFQGIPSSSFDQQGNLSIGIKEHLIFPEISSDDVSTIFELQVNITTSADSKEKGVSLLKHLGFPIKNN